VVYEDCPQETIELHANLKDRVTLGMYRFNDFTTEQNTPKEAAILEDLGSILEAGGSTITIVPEIQRKKFAKNFWNVGFSSFATLTRSASKLYQVRALLKNSLATQSPPCFGLLLLTPQLHMHRIYPRPPRIVSTLIPFPLSKLCYKN
jgi:hypothetical protein